ncbi:hypothetical protein BDQ17DRAFT_1437319 [Cyathus striatus]|nr:hypothetical protein BDQ17DRAFT_1437319 [Cyathus striatus]
MPPQSDGGFDHHHEYPDCYQIWLTGWTENPHDGSGGGGWDHMPNLYLPQPNIGPAYAPPPPNHQPVMMYRGGYPPPYHAPFQALQYPYGAWGLNWTPPTRQNQLPSQGAPMPIKAMEINNSNIALPMETMSNTAEDEQQVKKSKGKGKRQATFQELREMNDEEDLDREGTMLEDNDDMMDRVRFTVMTLLQCIDELNEDVDQLHYRNYTLEDRNTELKTHNENLRMEVKCLQAKQPVSREGDSGWNNHPPPRRCDPQDRIEASGSRRVSYREGPLPPPWETCAMKTLPTYKAQQSGPPMASGSLPMPMTSIEPQVGPSIEHRPLETQLTVPGPIWPPRNRRKDPSLADPSKPYQDDDDKASDSVPSSPDLNGLTEKQHTHLRNKYHVTLLKYQDEKWKEKMRDKAIPGHVPDALRVIEQRPGQFKPDNWLSDIGFPMSPLQVDALANLINDNQYKLLDVFQTIMRWVFPEHHDHAMEYVLTDSRYTEGVPTLNLLYSPGIPDIARPDSSFTHHALSMMGRAGQGRTINAPHRASTDGGAPLSICCCSTFGYLLSQALKPNSCEARVPFMHEFMFLVAQPNWYWDEINAWNASHPNNLFNPQTGSDFLCQHFFCPANATNNISMMNMITTLIQNDVPIGWIDHTYPYGLNYLNAHYTNSPMWKPLFTEMDDLRLECLWRYEPSTFLHLRDYPCPNVAGPSSSAWGHLKTGSNDPTMDISEPAPEAEPQVQILLPSLLPDDGSNNLVHLGGGMASGSGSNNLPAHMADVLGAPSTMDIDDEAQPYCSLTPQPPACPSLPPHPPSA